MRLARPILFLLLAAVALSLAPAAPLRAQTAPEAAASAASSAPPDAQDTSEPADGQSPPPLPSPVPTADDPKIHKLAVQQFLAWQGGTVDRSLYADDVNDQINDVQLDRAAKTLANLGGLQTATFRGVSHPKGLDVYVYRMQCERASVDMEFALTPEGKIMMIFFA